MVAILVGSFHPKTGNMFLLASHSVPSWGKPDHGDSLRREERCGGERDAGDRDHRQGVILLDQLLGRRQCAGREVTVSPTTYLKWYPC